MFLLQVVTLGIYRLYYFIKTRREIMDRNPKIKIMSPAFLFVPIGIVIISIVALIVVTIGTAASHASTSCASTSTYSTQYTTGSTDTVLQSCSSSSAAPFIMIIVLYLAIFVGFILFVIWEWSYSHGVDAITEGKLGFALSLIILILVPDGIDILIIQDYFNKLSPVPINTAPQPQFGNSFPLNPPAESIPPQQFAAPQPIVTPPENSVGSPQVTPPTTQPATQGFENSQGSPLTPPSTKTPAEPSEPQTPPATPFG